MNRKERNKLIFKRFLMNGAIVTCSLYCYAKDGLSLVPFLILGGLTWLFILSFIFFDVIPSIFSTRIKEERPAIVLGRKRKWLLYLTRDVENKIEINYPWLLVLMFICIEYSIFPVTMTYIYWICFGAYFGIKVLRYSERYQKQYAPKEEVSEQKMTKNNKRPRRF